MDISIWHGMFLKKVSGFEEIQGKHTISMKITCKGLGKDIVNGASSMSGFLSLGEYYCIRLCFIT